MSKRLKVINVLSPDFYQDAHIKGSINVPLEDLKDYAEHMTKDMMIIVYCAHYGCDVSARAWHVLHELGFDNVFAYEGGMQEWYRAGYPSVGPAALAYLQETTVLQDDDRAVQSMSKETLRTRMEREALL